MRNPEKAPPVRQPTSLRGGVGLGANPLEALRQRTPEWNETQQSQWVLGAERC